MFWNVSPKFKTLCKQRGCQTFLRDELIFCLMELGMSRNIQHQYLHPASLAVLSIQPPLHFATLFSCMCEPCLSFYCEKHMSFNLEIYTSLFCNGGQRRSLLVYLGIFWDASQDLFQYVYLTLVNANVNSYFCKPH